MVYDTLKRQHNYKTHTTHNKLPSFGKEYPFFQTAGKTSHEAHCTKLRALTKVVDSFFPIESFRKKFVILKWLLHSEQLKEHMITILEC